MNRILVIASICGLVASPAVAQQMDPRPTMTVGDAAAKPGQTAYGAIRIAAGPDSATNLPVAVINGARPGKVIALVAGSHGTEYTSVVALDRLISQIDPAKLTGTVIVAPLLNVFSFTQMTVHTNPIDGKGMNGQYPGDAAGTQTPRALAAVAQQVVKPADVVIDLHGGDLDEDLRPYSYWFRTGKAAQDDASKALALAFGLDHIIITDIDLANPRSSRSLSGYALSLGKTALVAEAGRTGTVLPDDVEMLVDGVLNVMGTLHMIDRKVMPLERPVWLDSGARVAADSAGMFFATVTRGMFVAEGAKVGYTTDYLGRSTGEVKAPASGVVTFVRGVPSMWKNATLINVGRVLSAPPPYNPPK